MRFLLPFIPFLFLLSCSADQPASSLDKTTETTPVKSASKVAVAPVTKTKTPNGHAIYARKCASCHGQNGEKVALNLSQVIKGWPKARTVDALQGYKKGNYGQKLKGIMKGQVSTLTPQEVQAVATYISTL